MVTERSRFNRLQGRGPRESFFNANNIIIEGTGAGKPRPNTEEQMDGADWAVDSSFPELDIELLSRRRWKAVVSMPWNRVEDILVAEARALLK